MILGLDAYLTDWLNLVIRWTHVIAGIAWIGASIYFVFLDTSLERPREPGDAEKGVHGELWAVHGGGFYHVQKHLTSPSRLPEPLHWFKWEAYWTWISGFALLVLLYYLQADTYLIDSSVADISEGVAIAASVAGLVLAWVVYDLLCRTIRNDAALGVAIVGLTALAAWGAGELFSGRGAFIQVGAMLGTIMVASVLLVIIPAHWELIRAKQEERPPRLERGLEAKRRSVHNTYLALPVVLTMISNHFPFLYGHDQAWLVLVALMLIGAWVRHFFVLRRRGRTNLLIPVGAVAGLVALAIAIEPDSSQRPATAEPVDTSEAIAIVERRCTTCHSANPTSEQFTSAPGGVVLDTPEQIADRADAIRAQAVDSTAMPLGNVTRMTEEERASLGAWIDAGAPYMTVQ
jgi:uncharacterized membrane protein